MSTALSESPCTMPIPLPRRRGWQSADHVLSPDCVQGSLALAYPVPGEHTPVAPDSPGGGDPQRWAAAFVQAVVEVIASDRPLNQLVRWTSHGVYADIARRKQISAQSRASGAQRTPPRSGRHQVATVHVCQPTAEALEIAARVTTGNRSRAVAARLDYLNSRWTCTALDFG